MKNYDILLSQARKASENAYAPYSGFRVGAALMTESGKIFLGANVENSSYGATVCAERTAFVKAIFEGERKFKAIAVYSPDEEEINPCGICLQTMQEFCGGDFAVVREKGTVLFKDLLPQGFQLRQSSTNKKS